MSYGGVSPHFAPPYGGAAHGNDGEYVPGHGYISATQQRRQLEFIALMQRFRRPKVEYTGRRAELKAALEERGMGMYVERLLDLCRFESLRELKELEPEDLAKRGMVLSHARSLLASIPDPDPMTASAPSHSLKVTHGVPNGAAPPPAAPASAQPVPHAAPQPPVAVQPHAQPTSAAPAAADDDGVEMPVEEFLASLEPSQSATGQSSPLFASRAETPLNCSTGAASQPQDAVHAVGSQPHAPQPTLPLDTPAAQPQAAPAGPTAHQAAQPHASMMQPQVPVAQPQVSASPAAQPPTPMTQPQVQAPAAQPQPQAPMAPAQPQAPVGHPLPQASSASVSQPQPQSQTPFVAVAQPPQYVAPPVAAPVAHYQPVAQSVPAYHAHPPHPAPRAPSPGMWGHPTTPEERAHELLNAGWQVTCDPQDDPAAWMQRLRPCVGWADAALPPELARGIPQDWERPTGIQSIVLGNLPMDRDVVIASSTGSGKTAAYALPILRKLVQRGVHNVTSPFAVILAHTMELAEQIHQTVFDLVQHVQPPINILPIIGRSETMDQQLQRAAAMGTVHIVIGTVGRMGGIIRNTRALDITRVEHLVIDEADAIAKAHTDDPSHRSSGPTQIQNHLDSVLIPLGHIHPPVHTIVCSATIYEGLQEMLGFRAGYRGRGMVRDKAWFISNQSAMECKVPVFQVVQELRTTDFQERVHWTRHELAKLYAQNPTAKVLVFAKKAALDDVWRALQGSVQTPTGAAVAMHVTSGGLDPKQRLATMEYFRETQAACVLISSYGTTGRGFDETLPLVVLFHLPPTLDDYKHAIGRTGRADRPGQALSLFCRAEDGKRRGGLSEGLLRQFMAMGPIGHEWRDERGMATTAHCVQHV